MEDLEFLLVSSCDLLVHPVVIFGYFLGFFVHRIWERFLACLLEGFTHESVEALFLVICPSQTLRNALNLADFGWTREKVVLVFDSRFRKIWWVWGLDLLEMGCPWGIATIPKVSLESVAWFERSIEVKFEFFRRVRFFPKHPGKTGLTGFANRSDRFRKPVWPIWSTACFWADLLGLGLFCLEVALVQVSSSFELVCLDCGLFSLWGLLCKTGLTGFTQPVRDQVWANRSDQFGNPVGLVLVWQLSWFFSSVCFRVFWFWERSLLVPRVSSISIAMWSWKVCVGYFDCDIRT